MKVVPFTEDQLSFDQTQEEAMESETLKKAAAANCKDDFHYVFEKAFEGVVSTAWRKVAGAGLTDNCG